MKKVIIAWIIVAIVIGGVALFFRREPVLSFALWIVCGACLGEATLARKIKKIETDVACGDWPRKFREREEKRKKEDGNEE